MAYRHPIDKAHKQKRTTRRQKKYDHISITQWGVEYYQATKYELHRKVTNSSLQR